MALHVYLVLDKASQSKQYHSKTTIITNRGFVDFSAEITYQRYLALDKASQGIQYLSITPPPASDDLNILLNQPKITGCGTALGILAMVVKSSDLKLKMIPTLVEV